MLTGYIRLNTKDRNKFYAAKVFLNGRFVFLKRVHKTATEALNYAKRFAKRYGEKAL